MKSRNELPTLFENVTGLGAEIGVQRGLYSLEIAKHYTGKILCVDRDFLPEAYANLAPSKFDMAESDSATVSKNIDDGSLDFVYIDAGHTYEDVKADLEAWIPKVRKGGIVAGHDYFDGEWENINFGVKKAVDELGLEINTTTDDYYMDHAFNSWWFIK